MRRVESQELNSFAAGISVVWIGINLGGGHYGKACFWIALLMLNVGYWAKE